MKNKGFVLIETMIIICVLCVGLLSIYKSYSSLIGKINNETNNSIVENDYKAEYIAKRMLYNNVTDESFSYVKIDSSAKQICDINGCTGATLDDAANNIISSFDVLNLEKVYYIKGGLNAFINNDSLLMKLDGSTITYLNSIKNSLIETTGTVVLNVIVKTKDKTFGYYQLDSNYSDIGGGPSISDEEIFGVSNADFVLKTVIDGALENEFPKTNNYNVGLVCKDTLKEDEVRNIGNISWNGSAWQFSVTGITDPGIVCKVSFICRDVTKIGKCDGE